jgi:hypothetical protein
MYSNAYIVSFCESLANQLSMYPPGVVLRAITRGEPVATARGTNVTIFGMTVRGAPAHVQRAWYQSGARLYVCQMVPPTDRPVWLAHYICACIVKLQTLKHRATFLDICECALRRLGTLDTQPSSHLPPGLPMGATVESIRDLRAYLIERHVDRQGTLACSTP